MDYQKRGDASEPSAMLNACVCMVCLCGHTCAIAFVCGGQRTTPPTWVSLLCVPGIELRLSLLALYLVHENVITSTKIRVLKWALLKMMFRHAAL